MYKFAIIGCGRIAPRHAENIVKVGQLVAVCDVDAKKATNMANQYGATPYFSIDDLLKKAEVDIVVICTPNGFHAEHAIKALQARKHVLCEKPMCITTVAAWQMNDTAHFFRSKLYIVKQNRFNPAVQYVKGLLKKGALGRITSFNINCIWCRTQEYYPINGWRGTQELDGGLLYTQFSHFIDVLFWFLGDIEKATGIRSNSGKRENLQIEDTGAALLQMKNGALGTLHYTINAAEHNREGSFTIVGEKGTVKIGGQYLNTIEWDSFGKFEDSNTTDEANDYGFYTGSMSNHDKVYTDLVKALNNEPHQLSHTMEAVKTIEIIEKIYAASPYIA